MDCFAEPVIGRAFARPGGSQRRLPIEPNSASPPLNRCRQSWNDMKTLLPLLLLAMPSAASAADVGPCNTAATKVEMAVTLRLASEDRPVNINFRTRAEGVKVPSYLAAKYPDEMSIVLQYEFKQLNVRDDRFEVVVWFKGYPERLVVPFNAVKALYDKDELKCSDD
jgi:hypothetical protein